MKFKKLLLVISVIIICMFGLMLTTSYAWYSFENASTYFETVTKTEDIYVSYQDGEYINTDIAVPVSSEQIDKYSSKNNFNIKVVGTGDIMIGVSLIDVSIDSALNKESFVIDLFYQGSKIDTINGSKIETGTDIVFENVLLKDKVSNQFEVRVYILDDGTNQNDMMKKVFSAKVKIDVISRVNPELVDYENPDIKIGDITIDGEKSDKLPIDGYYVMTSSCDKGSKLSWDSLGGVLLYNKGSYMNDTCNLSFTSSTDYPLLSEMLPGSYVKYSGNNGCIGKKCSGENANYTNDDVMGYCTNEDYQFGTSGWRIGYIEDKSAYLISAGAPECMCTSSDGSISDSSCDTSLNESNINEIYQNMNKIALKYCNTNYASGGVCDSTTSWAMGVKDFEKITRKNLSSSSCYNSSGDNTCGYNNDLIDNGSYYWISGFYDNISSFGWEPSYRKIISYKTSSVNGVRPVLQLDSSVVVTSGIGTYDDPYVIKSK